MHCYVSGKVQEVWFRAYTQKQAQQLSITGWVKNLEDGRVEVLACGTTEQLDQLYTCLQQGPDNAKVSQVQRINKPWQPLDGFTIGL